MAGRIIQRFYQGWWASGELRRWQVATTDGWERIPMWRRENIVVVAPDEWNGSTWVVEVECAAFELCYVEADPAFCWCEVVRDA